MFAEWWVEPDDIALALAGVVDGAAVCVGVVESKGVVVSGVFECLLVWRCSGFELVFVTGDGGQSLVYGGWYRFYDVPWVV